jgi:tellurite resistance protein
MTPLPPNKLEHFPITMFATVMGLSGLTLVSHKMTWLFGADQTVFTLLAYTTLAIYIAILATYTAKSLKFPQAVLKDWSHPIKINFFPAMTISLLLLGTAFYPISERMSFFLWSTGCFFQFFLSLGVINSWINHAHYEVLHSTPAWFIPVVGNIIVPVVGVQHASVELSWFFFAWGLLFWVILLTLIINRLMFHNPIPQKLLPTLFIFIAPPSVGFIAYFKMTGDLDVFARLLYYWGAFFFILMLTQINRLVRIKFAMSWWAYTFPLAAFTLASGLMADHTLLVFFDYLTKALQVVTAIVIFALSVRTIIALLRCEICQPD